MTSSGFRSRVIALIAAYAIALHGFLAAFAALPVAAASTSGEGAPRFELCIHGVAAGALSPNTPGAPSSNDAHCKFCAALAHSLFVTPAPSGVLFIFQTPGEPIASVQNQNQVSFSRYFQKQPRGPPAVA
jgi:hypothetical protein